MLPINQNYIGLTVPWYKIPGIIKVIFTGERIYSHKFIEMAVSFDVTCEVLIHQRPVAIVYENSDLHSAANGVFEMLYFNDARVSILYYAYIFNINTVISFWNINGNSINKRVVLINIRVLCRLWLY